jgi:hypothetical protein
MSLINGKNLYISVRDESGTYYPVACDSSCTIRMSRPTLGITGPGDGLWRRIIPGGRIAASISGNGLINYNKNTSLAKLQQLLIEGTLIRMMCQIDEPTGGYIVYESSGYVTSMEMTGAYRALGSFVYEIEIDGAINIDNTIPVDENEIGIQNLLLVEPGGELLEIDNNENNLII